MYLTRIACDRVHIVIELVRKILYQLYVREPIKPVVDFLHVSFENTFKINYFKQAQNRA